MDSDGSSTVALTVTSTLWRDALGALEPLAERIVLATLEAATAADWVKAGEVSLLLTDDGEIRSLNEAYRSHDRPTNVLSFPGLDLIDGKAETPPAAAGGPVMLGDVVMSIERLASEAAGQRKPLPDHFAHLLVHGTLHLLGYDHDGDDRAETMEALEASILKSLGFAAPYRPIAEPEADDAGSRRPAVSAAS